MAAQWGFLSNSLNICFGHIKENLVETVRLSTHNILLLRYERVIFNYAFLLKA